MGPGLASQLASLQLMRGNAALLSSRTPDADVAASEIDGSEWISLTDWYQTCIQFCNKYSLSSFHMRNCLVHKAWPGCNLPFKLMITMTICLLTLLPPLTHRKRGKNPSFVVGEGGKLPPPPFPPSPTAKEGPTPYKGWALQQGGHSSFSPQLKTNSPPSPPPSFTSSCF